MSEGKIVVYLGYSDNSRDLILKKIFGYCLANSITPDEVVIEDLSSRNSNSLLMLSKAVSSETVDMVITNSRYDFSLNDSVASTIQKEFSKKCILILVENEKNHMFPMVYKTSQQILNRYDKAAAALKVGSKNLDLVGNLLGYRGKYTDDGLEIQLYPSEVKAAKTIFFQRVKEGRNLKQIQAFCKTYHIKTPDGRTISLPYLDKMFSNLNCYMGKDRLPNGKILNNKYPPILTEVHFQQYFEKNWPPGDNPEWKIVKRRFKNRMSELEYEI